MSKRDTILFTSIFLILLTFLVAPVFSAYATIDEVMVSAPSSASVGQKIQVQATVTTKSSG